MTDRLLRASRQLPAGVQPSILLGHLGHTGLTAHYGLTEIAHVKPTDTVVVSGAAG